MTTAVAYAAATAAAAPCLEPQCAAPEARPRTGGGFRIRVPLRLVVGGQYGDAALNVYIKIAALSLRTENCRAEVATLAAYLGLSKTAVERALTQLNTAGTDGIAEVVTIRHTSRDGEGKSAERYVRTMDDDELFVWLPARAATSLTPRQLRLYAAISYAQARRIPLALSDLQDVVRHQYGQSAGEPLGERQVMRLVDSLEDLGWVTIHRRQGPRGRHIYEAHTRPLHAVLDTPEPAPGAPVEAPATPDIHDGSAPRTADGSLYGEDPRTDRPGRKISAVGGGIRRRRSTGSKPVRPVDNSVSPTFRPPGHSEKRSNTSRPETAETSGDLTGRSWAVLEPVRHLLPGISSWVLRRIDAEIGRQLAQGTGMERLTARLTARYATTDPPRDPGRWILGAALVRHGCGLPACESGTLWHSSEPCQVCLDNTLHTDPTGAQQPEPVTEEQPVRPVSEPVAAAAVSVSWPIPAAVGQQLPALSREQLQDLRAAATPDLIRQAITEQGRAHALYVYGHALVLPQLATIDDPGGNPA